MFPLFPGRKTGAGIGDVLFSQPVNTLVYVQPVDNGDQFEINASHRDQNLLFLLRLAFVQGKLSRLTLRIWNALVLRKIA